MSSRDLPRRGRSSRAGRTGRAVSVAVAAVLALASCIPGVTVREGFGELRMLSEHGGTALEVVREPFAKGRHGHLTFETMVREFLHERLATELTGRSTSFDVVALDAPWLAEFAPSLAPLDALYTPGVRDDLFPVVLEEAQSRGSFVGMPLWTDADVLYYRTDLFGDPAEQAAFELRYGYPLRPPATWTEYRDAAEFFTRDIDGDGRTDLYGTDVKGGDPADWLATVAQAGAESLVLEGESVVVNDRAHVQALDLLRSVVAFAPPGASHLDAAGARILFLQGSLAMMRFRASAFPQLPPHSPVSGSVGVAPQVAGPAGVAGVPYTLYASVAAAASNRESAMDFLAASFEGNERMMATPPRLPARVSLFQAHSGEKGFEHYGALLATLQGAASRHLPVTPHWQEIAEAVLVPTLQRAIEGDTDSQTLLNEAKEQIEAILAPSAGSAGG